MITTQLAAMNGADANALVKIMHNTRSLTSKLFVAPAMNLGIWRDFFNFAKYDHGWRNVPPRSPAVC